MTHWKDYSISRLIDKFTSILYRPNHKISTMTSISTIWAVSFTLYLVGNPFIIIHWKFVVAACSFQMYG